MGVNISWKYYSDAIAALKDFLMNRVEMSPPNQQQQQQQQQKQQQPTEITPQNSHQPQPDQVPDTQEIKDLGRGSPDVESDQSEDEF